MFYRLLIKVIKMINNVKQRYLNKEEQDGMINAICNMEWNSFLFIDKKNCGNGATTTLLKRYKDYSKDSAASRVVVPNRGAVTSKGFDYPTHMGDETRTHGGDMWAVGGSNAPTLCAGTLSMLTSTRTRSRFTDFLREVKNTGLGIVIIIDEIHTYIQSESPQISELIQILNDAGVRYKLVGLSATIPKISGSYVPVYEVPCDKFRLTYQFDGELNLSKHYVQGACNVVYSLDSDKLTPCSYYISGSKVDRQMAIADTTAIRISVSEFDKVSNKGGWIGITSAVAAGTDLFVGEGPKHVNYLIDARNPITTWEDIDQIVARVRDAQQVSVTIIPATLPVSSTTTLPKDTRELFDKPQSNPVYMNIRAAKVRGSKIGAREVLGFNYEDKEVYIPHKWKYLPLALAVRYHKTHGHLPPSIHNRMSRKDVIRAFLDGPQAELWDFLSARKKAITTDPTAKAYIDEMVEVWNTRAMAEREEGDERIEVRDAAFVKENLLKTLKYIKYCIFGLKSNMRSLETKTEYFRSRVYNPWTATPRTIRHSFFNTVMSHITETDFSAAHARVLLAHLGQPLPTDIDIYLWACPTDRNKGKKEILTLINKLHFGKSTSDRVQWLGRHLPNFKYPKDPVNQSALYAFLEYLRTSSSEKGAETSGRYASSFYCQIERRLVDPIMQAVGTGYLHIHDGVDIFNFDPLTGEPRQFVVPSVVDVEWSVGCAPHEYGSFPLKAIDHSQNTVVPAGTEGAVVIPNTVSLRRVQRILDQDSRGKWRSDLSAWGLPPCRDVVQINYKIQEFLKSVAKGEVFKGSMMEPSEHHIDNCFTAWFVQVYGGSVYHKGEALHLTHPDWPEKARKAHKPHKAHVHTLDDSIVAVIRDSLKSEPHLSLRARADKLQMGRKKLTNYIDQITTTDRMQALESLTFGDVDDLI